MSDNNTTEKHPTWQALIDEAYARWQDGGDLAGRRYEDFVEALDDTHARAVALKNLNYQWENGGLAQWHNNGYSCDAELLRETLENFIDTEAGRQVRGLLEEGLECILEFYDELKDEYDRAAKLRFSRLADFQNEFCDTVDERMNEELGNLDASYYEINQAFMDNIETWLATTDEGQRVFQVREATA